MDVDSDPHAVGILRRMISDQVALALPFAFAALAQIVTGAVQRLGDEITANYFEIQQKETVVLDWESGAAGERRVERTALTVLPDAYHAHRIAAAASKNTEGIYALAGTVTLACSALPIAIDREVNLWYGIAIAVPVALGILIAVRFWTSRSIDYADRRWFGISRT